MSFLDNLENNLKALEGREEGTRDDGKRRAAEKNDAKAAAPWAEKLKESPWTKNLMAQATRAGFQRRVKVNLVWLGTTLRLEARSQRLELRPRANGVEQVCLEGDEWSKPQLVDLEKDPAPLLNEFMRRLDEEIAAAAAASAAAPDVIDEAED